MSHVRAASASKRRTVVAPKGVATCRSAERSEAKSFTSASGNFRSCRTFTTSAPTAPVAPTTPTTALFAMTRPPASEDQRGWF